ncbi:MAG: GHKL domain-containing protein [Erysipelotrichaceae bacterium]|nr:GHKL domain-containing protein [Erysipelotrichaceae bacterium]
MFFLWAIDYPLELFLAFIIFFIALNKKKKWYIYLPLTIVALFGIWQLYHIDFIYNNELLTISFYVLMMGITYLMIISAIDISPINALFVLGSILSMQHLIYKITMEIIIAIDMSLLSEIYYFLISYIAMLIIYPLIYLLVARKLKDYIDSTNVVANLVAIVLIISVEIILGIYEQKIFLSDFPNHKAISLLINSSNIIITAFNLVFIYITAILQHKKEENIILNLINNKNQSRYELAKVTVEEINMKYHDLKHALKKEDLDDELKKEIEETITNYKAIVNTNNKGVNVAIYEAQLRSIKEHIDLNVLIDGSIPSNIKNHHIYSVLSNLLENAIEATKKLAEPNKKHISLNIKSIKGSTIINIENFVDEKIVFKNGFPLTSKKDKSSHGYGLKSVSNIINNKYDGTISFKQIDDKFIVNIVLPII